MSTARKLVCAATAIALLATATGSATAGVADILQSKRLYGILGLGATTLFLVEAGKSRQDAGDFYELYKTAGTTQNARELYDESRRLDTRSAVLIALGAGTLGYSIHLLLSGGDKNAEKKAELDGGLVNVKGVAVDVGADPVSGRLQVGLSRGF